jgi:iron complex outermembrane recepter protein
MKSPPLIDSPLRHAVLACLSLPLCLTPGFAQSTAQTPAETSRQALPEVRISASPLAPPELQSVQPAQVLKGTDLDQAVSPSLGNTLTGLPGVHSSGFGIGAGRPVIRGLDGPRVRVTNNGLETLDASTLSPDHAITSEPLFARRIEVLRGPATLLYGGGAIGGLVNVVTDQIPTFRISGVRGQARLGSDSATRGHNAAASVQTGAGPWQFSFGAFDRAAGDYSIAGQAIVNDPTSARGRLPNSFSKGDGSQLGGAYVGQNFTFGLGYSELNNRYGIPSEADVFIRLRQQRLDWLGEWIAPVAGIERIKFTHAENRYGHREIEAPTGAIGTEFRNRGSDSRLEVVHQPWGGVRGAFGLQSRGRTISASGAEAYIPSTRETNNGLFYVGELPVGAGRIEFGARHERAELRPDDATGLTQRNFGLNSLSTGLLMPLPQGWALPGVALAVNLSSAQRAPVVEELYANGPHAATATFELGNNTLARERSTSIDIGLRKTTGPMQWQASLYNNRFKNYVYGSSTDANGDGLADRVDDQNVIQNDPSQPDAGEFSRLQYAQAKARFQGVELQWRWQPVNSPWSLRSFADVARGTIDAAGNAPRMSPSRVGVSTHYAAGAWSGFMSVQSVQRASRIAALESTTAGYTRLDAELAYTFKGMDRQRLTLFVQGRNLLNETIRLHTSYIKDVAPQPGRSVMTGLRAQF